MSHQLPDIDPEETAEWIDSFDAVVDAEGRTRARFLLMKLLERARDHAGRLPGHGLHPLREHHPPRPGAVVPRRRVRRAPHPRLHPLERGRHGDAGPTTAARASAATWPPTPARPRCTRSGFNHFFRGKSDGGFGDLVFFQGHASPGIYARAFVEGPPDRGPARQLPPGGRRARACPATPTPGSSPTSGSTPRCRWASARCAPSTRPT